jgi:Ran GTPase-activating protein (RanGAP) involved in mRNA processing and transport
LPRHASSAAFINEIEVLVKTQARWNRLREVLNLQRCVSSFTHIYLSKNKFATAGISRLAAALCMTRCVSHVELAHCEISPACGEALGNMLAQNSGIKTLVLAWNRLGYGVARLAEGLADNRVLETLDLSWNGCGYEETMAALSDALATDTLALRTLLLSQNRIKPEHAVILAEGVQRSLSLRHISLDGNPLGSMGRCVCTLLPFCACIMWTYVCATCCLHASPAVGPYCAP